MKPLDDKATGALFVNTYIKPSFEQQNQQSWNCVFKRCVKLKQCDLAVIKFTYYKTTHLIVNVVETKFIAGKYEVAKHVIETKAALVNEHKRMNEDTVDCGIRMQYYVVTKQEREGER